eukprot:1686409-Amphidinium_carterae.1
MTRLRGCGSRTACRIYMRDMCDLHGACRCKILDLTNWRQHQTCSCNAPPWFSTAWTPNQIWKSSLKAKRPLLQSHASHPTMRAQHR